jgi:N,N-dimethylformamidase
MLVGYVSDERYVAIEGVALEFIRNGVSVAVASRASGAVHADVAPGTYEVVLSKAGYGAKRVTVEVARDRPHQFRLLADQLLGYAWPKYVRSGEESEFRVH